MDEPKAGRTWHTYFVTGPSEEGKVLGVPQPAAAAQRH